MYRYLYKPFQTTFHVSLNYTAYSMVKHEYRYGSGEPCSIVRIMTYRLLTQNDLRLTCYTFQRVIPITYQNKQ